MNLVAYCYHATRRRLYYVDGTGEIVAHAHRALQDSIPVSQTFTARVLVYEYSSGVW